MQKTSVGELQAIRDALPTRFTNALAAAAKVLGRPPRHIGDTPWMDAALLQAAGVETVVFGAAGAGAHSGVEWVDLESVIKLAEILAEAAVDYCG